MSTPDERRDGSSRPGAVVPGDGEARVETADATVTNDAILHADGKGSPEQPHHATGAAASSSRRVPRGVMVGGIGALLAALLATLTVVLWPKGPMPVADDGPVAAATTVLPADTAFVKRQGQEVTLDGKPFRMLGFNVWEANVAKPQADSTNTLNNGSGLTDTFRAMGSSTNTVRSWFFQQYVTSGDRYDWTPFDRTLAAAKAHHVKVVATLVDQWTYGGTEFRDHDWYASRYKDTPGPLERVSYRQFVSDVVARYKDDPTIAMWELVNEPEAFTDRSETKCPADSAAVLSAFASDVAGLIKSIDSRHLVGLGAGGTGTCGTIGQDYRTVMSVPELDICSLHDYYGPDNAAAYEADNGLNVRVEQCAALDKPILIGEAGIKSTIGKQLRADAFDAKLTDQLSQQGVVGFLIWQFERNGKGSDQYVVAPGDPVLDVLKRHAK